MQSLESRYSQLGIPQEAISHEFPATIHGQLATKLLDRIDQKAKGPRIVKVGEPIDTPQEPRVVAANLVAGVHNTLVHTYQILYSDQIPVIFTSQDQYDHFANRGLLSLSEDQARIALTTLEAEDLEKVIYRDLTIQTQQRIEQAEQERDLPSYLMWSLEGSDQYYRRHNMLVTEAIYNAVIGQPAPSVEDIFKEVATEERKARFKTEARLVRRMHAMLADLPDEDKIKVAILRLPKEIDSARSPRALTYLPARSFNRWGYSPEDAQTEAMERYCITDAACIHHSFDSLYRLVRRQLPGGQFAPRAFYITSYSAQNHEGLTGFPESAKRFLQVSFADDTPVFPAIQGEIIKTHPQVTFIKNPAILREDVVPNLVVDNGEMHFILGEDEYGDKITQDLIPYVLDSLVDGVSNAYNIRVDQFFR